MRSNVETNVRANTNRNVEEKAENDRSRNACIFEHRVASRRAVPRFLQQPCVFSSYRHFVATRLLAHLKVAVTQYRVSRPKRGETRRKKVRNRDNREDRKKSVANK